MTSGQKTDSEASGTMPWSMYNRDGQRKYLTRTETKNFVRAAGKSRPDIQGFCLIMAATGCRISEALTLSARSIDFATETIVIECLKKRGRRVFRAIPLEKSLLARLKQWLLAGLLGQERLFPWSRMTGYRRICEVMQAAGVRGSYATPKGLRHAFGINAIQSGVPLNMVQRWLGHADIKTTAIYTSATGDEERSIARRMWTKGEAQPPSRDISNDVCDDSTEQDLVPIIDAVVGQNNRSPSLRSEPAAEKICLEKSVQNQAKEKSICAVRHFWLFCRKLFCENIDTCNDRAHIYTSRLVHCS